MYSNIDPTCNKNIQKTDEFDASENLDQIYDKINRKSDEDYSAVMTWMIAYSYSRSIKKTYQLLFDVFTRYD